VWLTGVWLTADLARGQLDDQRRQAADLARGQLDDQRRQAA